VKFKPDVDVEYCSCPDNSMRGQKCKHIWSIEFATRFDTLKDIDKLPEKGQKVFQPMNDKYLSPIGRVDEQIAAATIEAKSYTDDDYSF